jgi:hypothetical protein
VSGSALKCGQYGCEHNHRFCELGEKLGVTETGRFVVVGGGQPYLNVRGDSDGAALYHMIDRRKLRRLRDALTKALARKPKGRKR